MAYLIQHQLAVYIISIVEDGATTVGIHFTDTKEDASLELGDVYPLGKEYQQLVDWQTCMQNQQTCMHACTETIITFFH